MNISNLLARHARKYPNQVAVISLGQETTYQQLDDQVNKIAGSLLRRTCCLPSDCRLTAHRKCGPVVNEMVGVRRRATF